ncbi:MAG: hypothetical protein IPI10_02485 [Bacteroidetes bacterium]|nr:hypothetical protein [Bacteroidota bacterium]
MINSENSWIKSRLYDFLFILFPPFACLLVIYFFPHLFINEKHESELLWFILIVCIDVGHVYSTIYRTYMDKETIRKNRMLFFLSPLLLYLTGVMLHSIHPLFFWRAMAYLAVFHFIRQQYGFMRLYSRNEKQNPIFRKIDGVTIYAATLYPMIYWHTQGKQNFNWFIENDFFYINQPGLTPVFFVVYLAILFIYLVKEIFIVFTEKKFNLPKNLLMLGTIVSWYMGIVYFKGDLTFTLLNVVSHGIPYYALVWAYGNNQQKKITMKENWMKLFFNPKNIFLFVGFLVVLAYLEEMLWDGFIWKEHNSVFPLTNLLPDLTGFKSLTSLVIPLLALPQLMHYFIDGFIWKMKKDKFGWSTFLFSKSKVIQSDNLKA